MEEFVAWTVSNEKVYRQGSNSTDKEYVAVYATGDLTFLDDAFTSVQGSDDLFVLWSWTDDSASTRFKLYSTTDVRQQKAKDDFKYPTPYLRMIQDGLWTSFQVSHRAHYIAGPWAANGRNMSNGQRLLGIVNTQEPEGSNAHIKNPPGGANEQVDLVQWISDNDMVVRNRSGRKFVWHVDTNTYDELPAMPASFNGYALTSEFYSPDGLKFGGLMSKDGGQTQEVWTANADYTGMQQITNAGLKLAEFQWLGSAKYLMVNFVGLPAASDGNSCNYAILNASTNRNVNASQVGDSRTPKYLPCLFRATK